MRNVEGETGLEPATFSSEAGQPERYGIVLGRAGVGRRAVVCFSEHPLPRGAEAGCSPPRVEVGPDRNTTRPDCVLFGAEAMTRSQSFDRPPRLRGANGEPRRDITEVAVMGTRFRLPSRWLAAAILVGLVAACGGTIAPPSSPVSPSPTPSLAASPSPSLASASPSPTLTPSRPPSPSPGPTPAATWPPPGAEIYVVVRGDTLSKIGRLYDVTVAQLLAANPQITNKNLIRPGDRIAIPPILTPGVALPDLAISQAKRAPVDAAAAKEAAGWVNAFGVDLYRAMLEDGSLDPKANAAISPTSIAIALAMADAGARGTTATQIEAVLNAPDGAALSRGLGSLGQVLASRDRSWRDGTTHAVALRLANGAFAQHGWAIESAYLDRIAADYGSGVYLVDFAADLGAALRTINAWVNSQTRGRVPRLIDTLHRQTTLVLANAVYLRAEWEAWFGKELTKPEPFRRLGGSTVAVPTMHRTAGGGCLSPPIPYVKGDGWRAVDLRTLAPDDGSPLSMVVIVPDDLRAFESSLSAAQLQAIAAKLDRQRRMFDTGQLPQGARCTYPNGCYPYDLALHLPKFRVESGASLAGVLSSLGMPVAFDGSQADLAGIHEPEGAGDRLFVTDVIHQANVAIDERGIEAAAATLIEGGCAGPSPLKKLELKVDRPFIYAVRDVATGAILFLGRVVDPSVGS